MTRPEPLTAGETERLARWERNARIGLAAGIALALIWLIANATVDDRLVVAVIASLGMAVLVGVGIAVQIGLRCPRCRTTIPFGRGLSLPARCSVCGVGLR